MVRLTLGVHGPQRYSGPAFYVAQTLLMELPPATPMLRALIPFASPHLIDSRGIIHDGPDDLTLPGTAGIMLSVRPYYVIGHCLIAWAFVATGALVGIALATRSQEPAA